MPFKTIQSKLSWGSFSHDESTSATARQEGNVQHSAPAVSEEASSPSGEAIDSSQHLRQPTALYSGQPLNLDKLCNKNSFLKQYMFADHGPARRKRKFVQCITCSENETVAIKSARNGVCPIARGIRADSMERIKLVIDHLSSASHSAAMEHQKLVDMYERQSSKHPWLASLKKHRAEVVDFLIQLAMDVYNDSLLVTPSANSWPARSLTVMAAQCVVRDMEEEFKPFQPPASMLHYRDPKIYKDMLLIIGNHVRTQTISALNSSLAFAI